VQTNNLPERKKTIADEFSLDCTNIIKDKPAKTVIQSTNTYRKANVTSHIKKRSDHGEVTTNSLSRKK
jgi:hypothetical protein